MGPACEVASAIRLIGYRIDRIHYRLDQFVSGARSRRDPAPRPPCKQIGKQLCHRRQNVREIELVQRIFNGPDGFEQQTLSSGPNSFSTFNSCHGHVSCSTTFDGSIARRLAVALESAAVTLCNCCVDHLRQRIVERGLPVP
jgi:hypothetical protein